MSKYLCICDGGNVRSRALAYVLHDLMGQEAIAIGRRWASPETMRMLCEWADKVVIMEPCMASSVPVEFRDKLKCVNVGPDTYGLNIPDNLMSLVGDGARRLLAKESP